MRTSDYKNKDRERLDKGILRDIVTRISPNADSEFLVGTAADQATWESGETARTSLGMGPDLAIGFTSDDFAHGTVTTGTITPAPDSGEENFQTLTNGGAFTLAPPANSCSIVLHVTNNASAGAITTSGFTVVDGDSLTMTNADEFIGYITKVGDVSHLTWKALQ